MGVHVVRLERVDAQPGPRRHRRPPRRRRWSRGCRSRRPPRRPPAGPPRAPRSSPPRGGTCRCAGRPAAAPARTPRAGAPARACGHAPRRSGASPPAASAGSATVLGWRPAKGMDGRSGAARRSCAEHGRPPSGPFSPTDRGRRRACCRSAGRYQPRRASALVDEPQRAADRRHAAGGHGDLRDASRRRAPRSPRWPSRSRWPRPDRPRRPCHPRRRATIRWSPRTPRHRGWGA